MNIEHDPLLPICIDCGARHRPPTNGAGEAIWCRGTPTWYTRLARALATGSIDVDARHPCPCYEIGSHVARMDEHVYSWRCLQFRKRLELADYERALETYRSMRAHHRARVEGRVFQ